MTIFLQDCSICAWCVSLNSTPAVAAVIKKTMLCNCCQETACIVYKGEARTQFLPGELLTGNKPVPFYNDVLLFHSVISVKKLAF